MRKPTPQRTLQCIIMARCSNVSQIAFQRSRRLINSHIIIVKNNKQIITLIGSCIVQTLEGQTARHCAIAYYSHDIMLFTTQFGCFCHTIGSRDRRRGVSCAKRIILTLGNTRKTAYTPHFAICRKSIPTTSNNLMCIGLVSHIPHKFILRSIIHIVYRYGKFHNTKTRSQVSGILRALLDDILSQLLTITGQLLHRQSFQVGRRVYFPKQVIFYMFKRSHQSNFSKLILASLKPQGTLFPMLRLASQSAATPHALP